MAGDWIKIEHTLPDKPEVISMASALKIDQDSASGKLLRVWIWADQNSVDGEGIDITCAFIDRLAGKRGFAESMRKIGWLVGDDGCISFPGFERHNGSTAKARAETNRRVAKSRSGNRKNVTPVTEKTLQKPLPEKRREEKSIHTQPSGPGIEDCETFAKACMPHDHEFAASVGRQFHGMFSVKHWITQNGDNLVQGSAWKHRLRQMIEEEARKPRGGSGFRQSAAAAGKPEKLEWE